MSNLTKRMIKEVFLDMLREKPIDKITVKGIVEKCGINRQTFYYHFSDIYDLIQWTLAEDLAAFRVENPVDEANWEGQISELFRYIHTNKRAVLHAYNPVNRIYYERFLKEQAAPIMRKRLALSPLSENVPQEKLDFICNVLTIAIAGFLLQWVEEGVPGEYQIRLDDYFTLFHGSIDFILGQFRKE